MSAKGGSTYVVLALNSKNLTVFVLIRLPNLLVGTANFTNVVSVLSLFTLSITRSSVMLQTVTNGIIYVAVLSPKRNTWTKIHVCTLTPGFVLIVTLLHLQIFVLLNLRKR